MIELLLIAAVAGAIANRVGAKFARSLPSASKWKRPLTIVFGGGGHSEEG